MSLLFHQVKALVVKDFQVWTSNKSNLRREYLIPALMSWFLYQILVSSPTSQAGAIDLPIMLSVTITVFIRTFVFEIVWEKSEKYKEYQRINGVTIQAYHISWIIFGFIRVLLISIILFIGIIAASSSVKPPIDQSTLILMFINYLLFGVATIALILALSTLFSTPKLAGDILGMMLSLLSLLFTQISSTNESWLYRLTAFIPQFSMCYGLLAQFAGANSLMPGPNEAIVYQIINIVLYFSLFIVLDQIVPDEFGIKKSMFSLFKKKKVVNDGREGLLAYTDQGDFSSAKFHQTFENPNKLKRSIFVNNLVKNFGEAQIIKKISFMVYEKQIYCLLGHNGAGKTTTINILTGILESESGDIFYGDLNFRTDFEEVRKTLGFCAQKDILYEDLTVEQHLRMIGVIRGIDPSRIEEQINIVCQRIGITSELGKAAKMLSGGNKRKLCLAMATIGNTKVIFLDEPTSGLDANSRRTVWEVLRRLKSEGITIILTTHHLDEAEELSDRIAILSKGNLHSVGTAHYLKKQFGEGYQLIITPRMDRGEVFVTQFPNLGGIIHETVISKIPTAIRNDKTPPEIIKYALPFSESDKFSTLFNHLEQIDGIQLSLEMNTLEDAFIKIGVDEEIQDAKDNHRAIEIPQVPQSINSNPQYKFLDQFKAMFMRRLLVNIRTPQTIIMTIFPIVFLLVMISISHLTSDSTGSSITLAVMICMAFALNSSVYCGFPVGERELKLKYLLKVMGCRNMAYWLGTWALDTLWITTLIIILFGVMLLIGVTFSDPGIFFICLIFFGIANISNAYMWGFMFDRAQTAYKSYGPFCMLILFLFPFLGAIIFYQKTVWLSDIFRGIGYIGGPYLFLMELSIAQTPHINAIWPILSTNSSMYIIFLLLQGILAFVITLILESRKFNVSFQPSKSVLENDATNRLSEPTEIVSEARKVEAANNYDPIKTIDLKKTYPNGFRAVNGISFGVEKKQIFGLLGPNGAGKSTTFNILTALIPRSSGSAKLLDHEIDQNMPEVYKEVGICPQFDALWENLTVYEHLKLFGQLKGLSGKDLEENISYYISTMQLSDHIKKPSKILSGGNKRKLCVSLALIGSPSLQFFDEPSTGLDPVARRYLYDTLTSNLHYREASIILTTHSLTEAEDLCHKIGILINGKFVCLGTTAYLKQKYGSGYRIIVPVASINPKEGEFQKFEFEIREKLGAQRVYEGAQEFLNYHLPVDNFKFSRAFETLATLKNAKIISDYSLINTTLEQIFINFSKAQIQVST